MHDKDNIQRSSCYLIILPSQSFCIITSIKGAPFQISAERLQDTRKRNCFPFSTTALKIHVSPKTKEILDTFGTFELVCRGEVVLKVRLLIRGFPHFAEIVTHSCPPCLLSREPNCRSFPQRREEIILASPVERDCQVVSHVTEILRGGTKRMIIVRTHPSCDHVSPIAIYNLSSKSFSAIFLLEQRSRGEIFFPQFNSDVVRRQFYFNV